MSPANENDNAKTEQQAEPELSDKQLAEVSGGATEELKGSYNFLLEVAGVTPDPTAAPPLARKKP